jgi:16S rRNA (guanine966-N2)-methyltransferase
VHVPKGLDVRPTQDRVRESVFGALAARLEGVRFLDLYAGSGSVGLEALSRGASDVVWVESSRQAYQVLMRNLREITGESTRGSTAILADVPQYVMRPPAAPFDVIYVDPPYGDAALGRVLSAVADPTWLSEDGVLLVETAIRQDVPPIGGMVPVAEKSYGRTKVSRLVWSHPHHQRPTD